MDPDTEDALLKAEPEGAVTRRSVAYGALGLLLAGAALTRLGGVRVPGGTVPTLAIAQLPALTEAEAEAALAGPAFTAADRAACLAALRRRDIVLVRLPIYGLGDAIGRAASVSCRLVSRRVSLGVDPAPLVLPIGRAGQVMIGNPGSGALTAGVVQVTGPTPLPPIPSGETLVLNVIVQ